MNVSITLPESPDPIRLLTNELAVVAKALTIIKKREEIFLNTLVMAKGRSPRCSTAIKNKNQVLIEINACTIVQIEIPKIRLSKWISMRWKR